MEDESSRVDPTEKWLRRCTLIGSIGFTALFGHAFVYTTISCNARNWCEYNDPDCRLSTLNHWLVVR
jgi:hypothetical protein